MGEPARGPAAGQPVTPSQRLKLAKEQEVTLKGAEARRDARYGGFGNQGFVPNQGMQQEAGPSTRTYATRRDANWRSIGLEDVQGADSRAAAHFANAQGQNQQNQRFSSRAVDPSSVFANENSGRGLKGAEARREARREMFQGGGMRNNNNNFRGTPAQGLGQMSGRQVDMSSMYNSYAMQSNMQNFKVRGADLRREMRYSSPDMYTMGMPGNANGMMFNRYNRNMMFSGSSAMGARSQVSARRPDVW